MDPATFFSGRDPLPAMSTGFVSEEPLGSLALEQDGDESRTLV